MNARISEVMTCPMPILEHDTVQIAHGAGGKLSKELIGKIFLPRFSNETLERLEDQALLDFPGGRLALSTDSFVVDPVFFPGGDIGDLAINGTVNDVCMSGAKPLFISVGFILEEGFEMKNVHRIAVSMERATKEAEVKIVTGDTKVVNKGCCDKVFINTTGVGVVPDGVNISACNIEIGDKILLSGSIAEHGMAVMMSRSELSFQSQVASDTAPLNSLVDDMLSVTKEIHTMRDPTRGGLAATLNELSEASNVGIKLFADSIPVKPEVQGACEVLGIDPLYVANEGKLVAFVPNKVTSKILAKMRKHKYGKDAVIIGEAVSEHPGTVVISTGLGVERIVDMPVGEQLPRIC